MLDVMEKRAKELRKELKRDKQRLEVALAELIEPGENKPGLVSELKQQLQVLRAKRDTYLQQYSDLPARRQTLKQNLLALDDKLTSAQEKAARLNDDIGELQELAITYTTGVIRIDGKKG